MSAGWGTLARLCSVNAAIGGLAALPANLFNRLITVELALPALLPGLLVVGVVGSMMQLAAAHARATGTRMGVFGAAQAIAAGLAGLVATGLLDLTRLILPDAAAYGVVFTLEAVLFLIAAVVAAKVMQGSDMNDATLVPGE